jgi:hypothetical protein
VIPARVAAKIVAEPEGGCWRWTGATTLSNAGNRYGNVKVGDGTRRAHRYVWELECGPIPPGMVLHHRCGLKLCVNPGHLELKAARNHGRDHATTDTCGAGHPWTDENTHYQLRLDGRWRRRCRECVRGWRRAAYRRSKVGHPEV